MWLYPYLYRYPTVQKPEEKKITVEQLNKLTWAGEIIHAKLEAMSKEEAQAYAANFRVLIDMIDKGSEQLIEKVQNKS